MQCGASAKSVGAIRMLMPILRAENTDEQAFLAGERHSSGDEMTITALEKYCFTSSCTSATVTFLIRSS